MNKEPHALRERLRNIALRHPEARECVSKILKRMSEDRRKKMEDILHSFYVDQGRWSHEDFQRELDAKKNAVVFGPYPNEHPTFY